MRDGENRIIKPHPASLQELRTIFAITDRVTYLNHAATGPISRNVQAAIQRQTDIHATYNESATARYEPVYTQCRAAAARLVRSRPERIAFVQNTSHGISLLANGQDWREGDNVVVPEMEFPSNYLAWLSLERQGVELRKLRLVDGRVTPEQLSQTIDASTRVVALSQVQYFNGFRADLAAIAAVTHDHGARLVVDGTQSVGAVTIDVDAMGIDALVVSSHKWMLGPLGIGFMAFSDAMLQETRVSQLGWLSVNDPFAFNREIDLPDDATRFEPGTENSAGIFGLARRLEEIESYTIEGIERRVLSLTGRLAETLQSRGVEIRSPMEPGSRSGILSFHRPDIASQATVEALQNQGIYIGFREGALRASPHYYNSEEEIDALVDALVG
jgi:cysteine desulfurase / selenocysteine lyase